MLKNTLLINFRLRLKIMNSLLDYFKNLETTEDVDLKHTLEVMYSRSGATQVEDAAWYYQNQTKVVLQNSGIKSVEPLKFLTQVETLVLDGNNVINISPLFELNNLSHLNLIGNDISSLVGIERLSQVRELFIGFNLLKDIFPLSNLRSLRMLGLKSNRISDIFPLEMLTSCSMINLEGNPVDTADVERLVGRLPGCKVKF